MYIQNNDSFIIEFYIAILASINIYFTQNQ